MKKFNVATYFDTWGNKKKQKVFNKESKFLIRMINKHKMKKYNILDVGGGIGLHMRYLLEKGYKVDGIDISKEQIKRAKLNIIKIKLGCGSWEGDPTGTNSIPFAVEGKCGSIRMKLMPAPKGASLVVEKECAKMLGLAGIQDLYSKTKGHTATKINLLKACFDALKKLSSIKTVASAS